ncbi:MAG: hypothetical protein HY331_14810 [Chloroflexi bacterium]|nr:hypothetical protein [Chloroflexota bacterium]
MSAAAEHDVDISAPGTLEVYVSAERLPRLLRKYSVESTASPNLILHVIESIWPFAPSARVVPAAVVALDLIEADDQRSRRAGEMLLKRLENGCDPHRYLGRSPAGSLAGASAAQSPAPGRLDTRRSANGRPPRGRARPDPAPPES